MAENNKPSAKVVLIGLLFPVILIIALDYTINGEIPGFGIDDLIKNCQFCIDIIHSSINLFAG